MSGTSSPLPERPDSPGSVRTAPVSEPAWLKRASAALCDDTPVDAPVENPTETIQEESTTGADNNSSTDPTLDEDVTDASPPPAPYSIADLNDKFREILARVEKLETTGTVPASVEVPEENEEIAAPLVSPIVVTTEKPNLETRMILSSKTGRSYLPVSRGIFVSIYGRRRNN
ncbi:hypothetical protein EXVG_00069 [Emiliania huxleyi virus 202]|nr:hypothetical protein EXVG_00069 [Emiliania huxleyi virus 202]AHA54479.1 hypothetical protein EhV18_00433 [Emiliania huxleyi virus 18]AHA55522.1 hypothetical protein EhV156_00427 [Emiliania huxleyi virus 156]